MAVKSGKGWVAGILACVVTLVSAEEPQVSSLLSEEEQLAVIQTLSRHIEQRSIVPQTGKQLVVQLTKNYDAYKYLGFEQPTDFARKLSDDIQALLNDPSFIIRASDEFNTVSTNSTTPASNTINIVNDEIALIELDLHSTHAQIDTLFNQVKDVDVLVFDLRNSYSPATRATDSLVYIVSYLFGDATALYQVTMPAMQQIKRVGTEDKVGGEKRPDVPVYILTSAQTGIAAERFAMVLQHLKRAYIVGEPTAGRVNETQDITLHSSLTLTQPIGVFLPANSEGALNGQTVSQNPLVQPDLLVTSFLAFNETQPLAEQSAIEYRVLQGRGTPQETFSQNKAQISYSDWRFYGSDCALEYRLSEPMYNANTERYQFAYQLRYYGHGSAKMRYTLGNGIEQMTQQANFADKKDLKSAISIGFKSFEAIKITSCRAL